MNLTEEFTITSLPLTRWVFPVEDQRQRQRDQEYRKESLERGNEIRSTEWPEVLIFKVSLICICTSIAFYFEDPLPNGWCIFFRS